MVEWLIDVCAANPSQPTSNGTSPLHMALMHGRTPTVLALIDRAAVTITLHPTLYTILIVLFTITHETKLIRNLSTVRITNHRLCDMHQFINLTSPYTTRYYTVLVGIGGRRRCTR